MHGAAFRDRTTTLLSRELGPALDQRLPGELPQTDDSVWVVRRLELDVTVNQSADALAARVADSLGRVLAATLVGDGDGSNAIRFASSAAHLRQLVVDLANGASASRWYYT